MVTPLKIVLVEDHQNLREILAKYLGNQGHIVIQAADAEELDETLAKEEVDIVVLDLFLPGEDGLSIARRLKEVRPLLFIIMLTARQKPEDRIKGYEHGADVYISKPSSALELSAVIDSYRKRLSAELPQQSNLNVSVQRRELVGQKVIGLNTVELTLIKALTQAPDQRLESYKLIALFDNTVDERSKSALEVHMARLRKKMIDVGAHAPAIRSIRNYGYQLVEHVTIS
jgi:DNA-binding response OmpR family regulator